MALIAGIALYYLQVYAYYDEVEPVDQGDVFVTSLISGEREALLIENFQGIDSDSSPIRYRACFDTVQSQAMMTETYVTYERAEPLVAPSWFDCFDAEAIAGDLASGAALALLAESNQPYGFDRIVAYYPDGRAFQWRQINKCGTASFAGDPLPEGCPPAPKED